MQSEDEAPFNFQGMLRKTKYNRASMKRSVSNQDALEGRERNVVSFELNNNEEVRSKFNLKPSISSNLIYQSSNSKNELTDTTIVNGALRPTESFNKKSIPSITRSNGDLGTDALGVYIQEEIRPGIILEGYAVEI